MIRMYGRQLAERAMNDAAESFTLMFTGIAGIFSHVAMAILIGVLALKGGKRFVDARRLRRTIAYVDLTAVPTGNLPTDRRPLPRREYVN